ncbi:CoA ester lyase [Ammoniphilus sp. 3BR4]|uniref:HpcH/HpaI aldolase/citrate lyase family protein n=1 Tax=Ammoniphilus sp. 3BR4 TaxID=3158265 RepID=UPI0034673ACC
MRSWLFVPGSNERALEKYQKTESDIFIFDLEDSVSVQEKLKARKLVKETLGRTQKINYVRINSVNTSFAQEDVFEVVQPGLSGIVMPKAETKEDVLRLDQQLCRWEEKRQLPVGSIRIVPLIESALGLYQAVEIAKSSPRVNRLMFGAVDFTLDINTQLTKTGTEILYARSKLVIASRVAGIDPPIDTVYIDIHDEEGLLHDAQMAKQLGFQGKLVIHPKQIRVVNNVFTPSKKEIEDAQRIVTANEQAEKDGLGVFQLDGKMVDLPVVERAKKVLDIYNKLII